MSELNSKRILFVIETKELTDKLLKSSLRKKCKGLIRLGHDVQTFNFDYALLQSSPVSNIRLSRRFFMHRLEDLLEKQIKYYDPEIIITCFAKGMTVETVRRMRKAAPGAVIIGHDVDLWPERHKGRIEAAHELDYVLTTYEGKGTATYRDGGARCIFMPHSSDPDIECRYEVADTWEADIFFTGQERMRTDRYPTEDLRARLLKRLATMSNCALYGYANEPKIGGLDYFRAISGARIGLSVNAINDIPLYHSDRFITYVSCGTMVLAKRIPDADLLFKDGVHVRYFDEVDEFFELAKWYLAHEDERNKIANAGMEFAHTEYNCVKMAQYILDIAQKGSYTAAWTK